MLENSNLQRESLTSQLRLLKDEFAKKSHDIEVKQSDSLNLHKNYTMDMERHHNRLRETEENYIYKLDVLREQNIHDVHFIRDENKQLQEINLKLDEEVSNLRRQIRFMRRDRGREDENEQKIIQEAVNIPPQQNLSNEIYQKEVSQQDSNKEQNPSTSQPKKAVNISLLDKNDNEFRKNLDDIFKEMEELKARAQRELVEY